MRRSFIVTALCGWILVVTACSSEADAGEPCGQPGATEDMCEDGTVCGFSAAKSGRLVCLPICFGDDQCPRGWECKDVVEKSKIKGCRLKG